MEKQKNLNRVKETFNKCDILVSHDTTYRIISTLGQGTFGKVVKCVETITKNTVAIKYTKDRGEARDELIALRMIKQHNISNKNFIQLYKDFEYMGNSCLVFELLDKSIQDVVHTKDEPFRVSEIRIITQQLLVALDALKSIGMAHTDIKPNNIMFVNQAEHPYRVKLIDFGLAGETSKVCRGTIQNLAYRAPEVILGLPMNESIDIWSLGCILGYMFIADHLFPYNSEYDVLKAMVHMLGQPEEAVVEKASRAEQFFHLICSTSHHSWRRKNSKEYEVKGTSTNKHRETTMLVKTFQRLPQMHATITDPTEQKDMFAFMDLLQRMLIIDPAKRITPREALQYPFITMKHLYGPKDKYATKEFEKIMLFLPDHKTLHFFRSSNGNLIPKPSVSHSHEVDKGPLMMTSGLANSESADTQKHTQQELGASSFKDFIKEWTFSAALRQVLTMWSLRLHVRNSLPENAQISFNIKSEINQGSRQDPNKLKNLYLRLLKLLIVLLGIMELYCRKVLNQMTRSLKQRLSRTFLNSFQTYSSGAEAVT